MLILGHSWLSNFAFFCSKNGLWAGPTWHMYVWAKYYSSWAIYSKSWLMDHEPLSHIWNNGSSVHEQFNESLAHRLNAILVKWAMFCEGRNVAEMNLKFRKLEGISRHPLYNPKLLHWTTLIALSFYTKNSSLSWQASNERVPGSKSICDILSSVRDNWEVRAN